MYTVRKQGEVNVSAQPTLSLYVAQDVGWVPPTLREGLPASVNLMPNPSPTGMPGA